MITYLIKEVQVIIFHSTGHWSAQTVSCKPRPYCQTADTQKVWVDRDVGIVFETGKVTCAEYCNCSGKINDVPILWSVSPYPLQSVPTPQQLSHREYEMKVKAFNIILGMLIYFT